MFRPIPSVRPPLPALPEATRRRRRWPSGAGALVAAISLSLAAPVPAGADAGAGAGNDGYTRTRYPIVLVHGLFGFDSFGPYDYFLGVPQALRDGGATVFAPAVSASNSNEVRGEQLLAALQQLKAAYGYTRFNLVGHSQGGETVRYVASVAPELVASVTTVGSPHQGSDTADGVIRDTQATGTTGAVAALGNALARLISVASGSPQNPQNTLAALGSLNSTGARDFNAKYPEGAPTSDCGQGPNLVNGVRYWSVGGTAVVTNPADPSDAVLAATSVYFKGKPNDGLVGRCSTHWGTVLRDDYPWNHLDEINQAFGLRGVFTPDPVQFYRTQANRLKAIGL